MNPNFVELGRQFAETYFRAFESGKDNVLQFFSVSNLKKFSDLDLV